MLARYPYQKVAVKAMDEDVFAFLKENPNPSDAQMHSFAEKKKYDVHELEKAVYRLATKFVHLMSNGLAGEKGFTEKDADPKELKMGIKIELEHTKDKDLSKKIALDHLAEIPNYYTLLEKMEEEAGIE